MKDLPELITDRNIFLTLRSECEKIVDTHQRLPEFVFRRSFAKYFAVEHGEVHSTEFTSFLSKMAYSCKDDSVNYMTIEPDPENYYFQHYHFYGLASFQPPTLEERYLAVMFRNRHPDSFLARGGDVSVFWGSSLKWAIFCDRISWELALIAVSENTDVPNTGLRSMDSSLLLDYVKGLYHSDRSKAVQFAKIFGMNYRLASQP